MSPSEVKLLADRLEELSSRVGSLEDAVIALMTRTARHDKTLRWLKNTGLVLLGIAVGTGLVRLDDVAALIVGP